MSRGVTVSSNHDVRLSLELRKQGLTFGFDLPMHNETYNIEKIKDGILKFNVLRAVECTRSLLRRRSEARAQLLLAYSLEPPPRGEALGGAVNLRYKKVLKSSTPHDVGHSC